MRRSGRALRFLPGLAIFALAGALIAPMASSAKPARGPVGPKQAVVVTLLKEYYLGDDPANYPSATYTFTVSKVLRAGSRLGNHWADGTPVNRRTVVFPVHAVATRTVEYDGSKTVTNIDAKYVFFRGEFGEWTFSIKSEHDTVGH